MMEEMPGPTKNELVSADPLVDHVILEDRISELPWEILDNILGRLPIKNTVATMILSRKWKHKWVDVSKLEFCFESYDYVDDDSVQFLKLVYHVLLSHRGPIDEFIFNNYSTRIFSGDINLWMSFLIRCDIKKLTFYSSYTSDMSSPVLSSFKQLRHLCLNNWWFDLSENALLFRALVSLHLTCCGPAEEIEKMISGSPNLEKLVLENTNFRGFTICAPNLKYLSLEGNIIEVCLERCLLLDDASFKMAVNEETWDGESQSTDSEDTVQETTHSLVQPPAWLSRMRRLVMNGLFLKHLVETYDWRGDSIDCYKLEVLELDTVHFDDSDEMATALSIFRSSPNLSILLINGLGSYKGDGDIYKFTEACMQEKCCFNKLSLVRITILRTHVMFEGGIDYILNKYEPSETSFSEIIRILLAGSPVLENMNIDYIYLESNDLWLMRKLMLFERASSQLKLTYKSREGSITYKP